MENLRFESIKNSLDHLLHTSDFLGETKILTHTFKNIDPSVLRRVIDLIKQKEKSAVIVLGSQCNGGSSILLGVTDDLIKKGMKANELITRIAPLIQGSGGGRPELAQAGSKDPSKIESAMNEIKRILKESLQR